MTHPQKVEPKSMRKSNTHLMVNIQLMKCRNVPGAEYYMLLEFVGLKRVEVAQYGWRQMQVDGSWWYGIKLMMVQWWYSKSPHKSQ
jgi:hypothetical protein